MLLDLCRMPPNLVLCPSPYWSTLRYCGFCLLPGFHRLLVGLALEIPGLLPLVFVALPLLAPCGVSRSFFFGRRWYSLLRTWLSSPRSPRPLVWLMVSRLFGFLLFWTPFDWLSKLLALLALGSSRLSPLSYRISFCDLLDACILFFRLGFLFVRFQRSF